jgi:hypothetical protein
MANEKTTVDALHSLTPSAEWALRGDVLEWLDSEQTEPTESAIATEVIRLQDEYDSQSYARARKAEYDALNQFELISDDSANSTTTHADAIAAIKTKYPKP